MNTNIWSNELNPFQKFKLLCWYNRMKAIKTGNFEAPVNIALDLVQGTEGKKLCGGLNCNFCMSNLEDYGKKAYIPKEILFKIPEFYQQWGVKSVCLAGHNSDPLMYNHEKLSKFLRLSYKNDVEIGFVTNGYLLTDNIIPEITRNCKWTGLSINAGRPETHAHITKTTPKVFNRIIENVRKLVNYCKKYKINHPVGYKYLITDENYTEIIDAIKIAKKIGCRQIQFRPCELPVERTKKIDVKIVEEQIKEGFKYEIANEFEVFGIREKFAPEFTKIAPKRCIATPLGSTWKADGDIVICPDRRWSAHEPKMILGNYIKEGLEVIRRKWGGKEHVAMIAEANKNINKCIRCTSYQWHNLYENTVESDPMDIRLI